MSKRHLIFVGTVGEGIFRSDDGEIFVRKSNGMFVECDVRSLAAHPEDTRVIYAGTSEGLYRTDDAGENWRRIDSPMNKLAIWSLLIDPRQPDTIFSGTRPAHIFRSTDAGRTWAQVGATINQLCNNLVFNRVTTLAADPIDTDTFWAGIEIDGVRKSCDCGETWGRCDTGLSSLDIHSLAIVPAGGLSRRILAATNNDLNVSENGGESWVPQKLAGKFHRPYFRGIVQKSDEPQVLLLGNGDGPPGSVGTMWRSSDGGMNWSEARLPCTPNSTIWGFAVHRADTNRMYAHSVSGEIYSSVDAGVSWEKLAREFGEIRSLIWVPA
jgi:photosystem II stability/assembly factor-like uncharacterized protein